MTKKETIVWHNEKRFLSELIPYELNPRKMSPEQEKKLKKSLNDIGYAEVIAINLDNRIIAGHQRHRILSQENKVDIEIDVRVPSRMLTEDEFKLYLINSNKISGDWDYDILGDLLTIDELKDFDFDLEDVGVDTETEEEEQPEVVFSDELDESPNYVVLYFSNDLDWLAAKTHFNLETVHSMRSNGKPWSKGIGRVVDGAKYLDGLKK